MNPGPGDGGASGGKGYSAIVRTGAGAPKVNIVVSHPTRSKPTRIVVKPRIVSRLTGGTPPPPAPNKTAARQSLGDVNQALVVGRARSPNPHPVHPKLSQVKNDLAYTFYKLKRRGRHIERDITEHYNNVRQMAWEQEEKELYGNKFRRKCLKYAKPDEGQTWLSPRSTTTTTTMGSLPGSSLCTPRVGRSILGTGSRQAMSLSPRAERRSLFRPSIDMDFLPPVD